MTPHGLELRLSWGEHVLAEHFLRADRASSFTVGSAPGCGFAMDDIAGPSFEIARAGPEGLELRFPEGVAGVLGDRPLSELVESGEAVPDGDGYAVAMAGGARAELELGAVTLRAEVRSCPQRVVVPLADRVDYNLLNIFVVVFAVASGFIVSALNADTEGEGYADGFAADGRVVAAKLLVQSVPASAPVVRQPAEHTVVPAEGAQSRQGPARSPRPVASPRAQARTMLGSIFNARGGALGNILGEGAAGGGELQAAVRGLAGTSTAGLDGPGFGGLGIRGVGTGGDPGNPYAIGLIGTKGRAAGKNLYGVRGYSMCGGPASGCLVRDTPNVAADDLNVNGGLDPELVRKVIKSHRDQIRYCYEVELARNSSLAGKLAVKFTIGTEGEVVSSQVAESNLGSADLNRCVTGRVQSWVFPKPKGGVVNVRYPFVFTQSGS